MAKVHLLCSVNWNPKAAKPDVDQMLGPLRTMRAHILQRGYDLAKLILLKGDDPKDLEFCALVLNDLAPANSKIEISTKLDNGMSEGIASCVSRAAEDAVISQAELWVDLTPGPKQRAAVMFAAASAVPGVQILYAEDHQGQYRVKSVPPLGSYNRWLGRHGILIRNYCEELIGLAREAEADNKGRHEELLLTISDLLGNHPGLEASYLRPRSNLLPVCEWVYREAIPRRLFGATKRWKGNSEAYLENAKGEHGRSAGLAAQTLWQLRNIVAHETPTKRWDVLALLDCLSFLAARLDSSVSLVAEIADQPPDEDRMFIAVDGDDIGRRFEERLAECVEDTQAVSLEKWSQRIQQELSELMMDLQEKWNGAFLARTGDGFLASFSAAALDDLRLHYDPKLTGATVTTGIGRTVKEAYLALKLGKARNRGGGIFYSFDPPEEKILWPAPVGVADE